MPGLLVLLFWLWLAVSIGIYAFRFFTTGSVRGAKPEEPAAEPDDPYAAFEVQLAAMATSDESVIPTTTEPGDLAAAPAPGFEAFSPAAGDLGAAPQADPTPIEQPAPIMANPSPIAAMASPPRVGDAVRALTLAEALEGIEMPADLIPLGTDRFDPRHMQFFTDAFAPGEVGAALADELERLGFAVTPIEDTAIRVDQPHASVEVRILPDRASIVGALGERGQALPDAAVVVDFQLG
ncbi:MAG: hypothetical protein AAF081_00135 [Actinomycetota bacterium]